MALLSHVITYFQEQSTLVTKKRITKAYAFAGVSYKVAPNQKIGLGVGYCQANFKSSSDGLSAQLGYTVEF